MTDQTPAGRLRCFLAVSAEEGADDDTPILDIVGFANLTFGDLRAILDELDRQRERVARMAETLTEVNTHRGQLVKDLTACAQATPGQFWRDVADSHAPRVPQDDPQPHAPGPATPSAPDSSHASSNAPQRPAQSLDAATHPLTPDQLDAYRNTLRIPPHVGHPTHYSIAHRLLAEVERLNTEVEQLQVELGLAITPDEDEGPYDHLTLRDIDPDAVHATEDNDYWEEAHEGLRHDDQGPF
jgi:hypothetical protein